MMEKVSRLMLWVVNTVILVTRLWPPGPHVALIMRGLAVSKSNDPNCLKAVLNQGIRKYPSQNVYFAFAVLPALKYLNMVIKML